MAESSATEDVVQETPPDGVETDRADPLQAIQALMADIAQMPIGDDRPIKALRKTLSGGL